MHCTRRITSDLVWVGGNDRRLSLFEGVYSVPDGVSYNSYLLSDEKTVLFDTVDSAIEKVFFENLDYALAGRKLDYVVIQHVEPDHSATLGDLLLRHPEATVICSPLAKVILKQFFNHEFNAEVKNEGDTLCTGRHNFRFFSAPMVHWPEVIITYDETDKILFSADAFGTFGALNGALFADEVDFDRDYMDEARRYYSNIIGKYGLQVQATLDKAAALDIKIICPLHGFVWRKDFCGYIDKYRKWSTYTPEKAGVVIAYASVYGNTANAADIIACRLRDRGIKKVMFDVSVKPASDIISAIFEYSHIVFASTTYNTEIFIRMDELLRDLIAHDLRNRTVGLIQNGSWAPTSGKLMHKLLSECSDVTILEPTVTLKSSLNDSGSAQIDELVNALNDSVKALEKSLTTPTYEVDEKTLFKLSYGLFVITARDGDRDNGCIINTAQQVTNNPCCISVTVSKQNLTHDMILKTGKFNLSVLSVQTPFSVFEQYGFKSGHEVNKFTDDNTYPRSQNGLIYLKEYANALISGKVIQTVDCGTHTLFIAEVDEAKILSDAEAATYAYYFEHIKPKPQTPKTSDGRVWICKICGYIYDEAAQGVKFEELPDDWTCPICKHPKSDFELKQ